MTRREETGTATLRVDGDDIVIEDFNVDTSAIDPDPDPDPDSDSDSDSDAATSAAAENAPDGAYPVGTAVDIWALSSYYRNTVRFPSRIHAYPDEKTVVAVSTVTDRYVTVKASGRVYRGNAIRGTIALMPTAYKARITERGAADPYSDGERR